MNNSEHPQVDAAEIVVEKDEPLASDPAQTEVVQTDNQRSEKSDRRRAVDDLMTTVKEQARRRGESSRTTIAGAYREHTRRSQAAIGALAIALIAAILAAVIRKRR
jgi:hypothetical protein